MGGPDVRGRPKPPRLSEAILSALLPPVDRAAILGDLAEEFSARFESHGRPEARGWYRRQVVRSAWPALRRRLASSPTDPDSASASGPAPGRDPSSRPPFGGRRPGPDAWWLDVKLGARMLVRFPGLTIISCLAMTLAVAASVGVTSGMRQTLMPILRIADGDRVVSVRNVDLESMDPDPQILHDFLAWRAGLDAFDELGAFASRNRRLSTGDEGGGDGVFTGIVTASTFALNPVRPHLGRMLSSADERTDAPAVVVLGHDVWVNRLGADPDVVGRAVRVDDRQVEVVGVMPPGYGWPTRFEMWEPFRFDPLAYARGGGPDLHLVGRLAPGVSLREAQAELDVAGERASSLFPESHTNLRPRVVPYLDSFLRASDRYLVLMGYSGFTLLVLIVCANVGLLILARTLARTGEIAVRSALGASRRRIIGQLFVETLVLSGLSVALGLLIASFGLDWTGQRIARVFWWADFGLRPSDFVFAGGLAVLSALVAGVVPGASATGKRMASHLQASAGGQARIGFGKGSALLVGSQMMLSVIVVGGTVLFASAAWRLAPDQLDIATDEYAIARIRLEEPVPTREEAESHEADFAAELAMVHDAIIERLGAESGVASVTLASGAPLFDHGAYFLEVDGQPAPEPGRLPEIVIRRDYVSSNYFEAFDKEILSGRGFTPSDHEEGTSVVVTEALAQRALGGADPVGTRMRIVARDLSRTPWLTVVGMIPDVWTIPDPLSPMGPAVFLPMRRGRVNPVDVIVRAPGGAGAFPQRMRSVALDVEPALQITGTITMATLREEQERGFRMLILGWVISGGAALLLSLASIYAIVSFTVTQRLREIGVRIALGAPGWRLVVAVLGRMAVPASVGAMLGGVLLSMLSYGETGDTAFVPHVTLGVMLFALAAASVPTARGLRAEPAEVLRAEL